MEADANNILSIYETKLTADFTKKLDSDNNLIGFNNGVYDLFNFEFRSGKPEDYITMTVSYDYQENHTEKYNDLLK